MRRALFSFALALAGLTAVPVSATAADPTCTLVAATLTINYDATSAQVTVQRSGDDIKLYNGTPGVNEIACVGGPTVNNVGNVNINDAGAAHNSTVLISEQGGTFAPGIPAEPTGTSEIEFAVNAADGTDRLSVDGTDNADNFLFGESAGGVLGANLNGDDDGDDIVGTDIEELDANGRKGDDTLSAVGSAGIPAIANPLTLPLVQLAGGNQNDTLRGGSGPDMLLGGTQDDDLNGGGGDDTQLGEDDNDSFSDNAGGDSSDGGNGTDIALYTDRTGSVNVSLDGAANDGGSEDGFADNVLATVENLKSGSGSDFLTGSVFANELTGNAGNDTVNGAGGDDKVSGSEGLDRLLGASGNDRLFGGSEGDNLVGAAGNDRLTGNTGPDFLLGKKGIDRLLARDGARDKRINCGKGSNKRESFTRDRNDPRPKSC